MAAHDDRHPGDPPGFGDAQGTRIGVPQPSGRDGTADEAEVAHEHPREGERAAKRPAGEGDPDSPTGAGIEAAEGMKSSGGDEGKFMRDGSHQHESGYGGRAGEPRRRVNEREGNATVDAEQEEERRGHEAPHERPADGSRGPADR